MKNPLYMALCVGLISACDSSVESATSNVGNANLIYEAIQYNGMHERTDRAELTAYVGVDPVRTEWCAAFVNAVLEESNITSNSNHKYPYTARAFLDWGNTVNEPKAGDIVVFPRGNQGWQGHVGFYVGQSHVNGVLYYHILGGNQRNRVGINLYPASKTLGIRRKIG